MTTSHSEEENGARRPLASHREKQLLVHILDNLANTKPKAAYAYEPISPENFNEGFRKITWGQIGNAVNGLAWWITAQLGRSSKFDTLLYLGPNDCRQLIIIFACIKTGYNV